MTAPLLRLACIVEGHAEVECVPVLVRRLRAEAIILPPMRVHRQKIVKPGELERAVELAARRLGGTGAILVLLDADGDCPRELGPALLSRCREARSDVPSTVILVKFEIEAWLLAGLPAGKRDIPADAAPVVDPESIRDPKALLAALMGRRYNPVLDAPRLVASLDIDHARAHSRSFAKLVRDLERF